MQQDPPDIIYHYTTLDALLDIIKSKSLWTSEIMCLNDSKEFILALSIAQKLINEKGVFPNVDSIFPFLKNAYRPYIFVCSFSVNGDLLSQWRGYGNTSSSISIGFNSSILRKNAEEQTYELLKCIYEPNVQQDLIYNIIDSSLAENEETQFESPYVKSLTYDKEVNRIIKLINILVAYSPIIKDKGFTEEAEWRLISCGNKERKISFRNGPSFLIPYSYFDLGELGEIIKEVIIGPTPYPDISEQSLAKLLKMNKLDSFVKVQKSEIPYRSR